VLRAVVAYHSPWWLPAQVLALARQQFGCATLAGVPLEDAPIVGGFGAHWEARVMGSELMSYGSGSGETYLSDLTLAFLEDTSALCGVGMRATFCVPPPPRARQGPPTPFVDLCAVPLRT
jgi:hypothetical protein